MRLRKKSRPMETESRGLLGKDVLFVPEQLLMDYDPSISILCFQEEEDR